MAIRNSRTRQIVATTALLLAGGAGAWAAGPAPQPAAVPQVGGGLPSPGELARVPVGVIAGGAQGELAANIENPYANQPQAVQEGKQLFVQMNCAGCHSYDGTGNMGPNLTDKSWRYGGTPAQIFNSIYDGRSLGMPAWGRALPASAIWKIVAYIQSLGGTFAPDQYQASQQGDQPDENVAPELAGSNAAKPPQ